MDYAAGHGTKDEPHQLHNPRFCLAAVDDALSAATLHSQSLEAVHPSGDAKKRRFSDIGLAVSLFQPTSRP